MQSELASGSPEDAAAFAERGARVRSLVDDLFQRLLNAADGPAYPVHDGLLGVCRDLQELAAERFVPLGAACGHLEQPLGLLGRAALSGLSRRERRDLRTVVRAIECALRSASSDAEATIHELTLRYAATDLVLMLRKVCQSFATLFGERRVTVVVQAPERIRFEGDIRKVERVMLNLLFNAAKYTPVDGEIRVQLHEEAADDLVHLDVSDSGPGISPKQRGALFERSRVMDRSGVPMNGGTTLSLASSRDVVELHGGSLTLTPSLCGGATFRVTLPRSAPLGVIARPETYEPSDLVPNVVGIARAELRAEALLGADPSPASDKPLVLIIEDSRSVHRLLVECLAAEFATASAFDGAEGLVAIDRLRPDLVITDIVMPGLDGEKLLSIVRQRPELSRIPVLVLTGIEDLHERLALLRKGAQDLIAKPFFPEEVVVRARNLVQAKRARDILSAEAQSRDIGLVGLAEEVRVQRRRLRAALEDSELALELAERANRSKENFLRMIAHELKTPATAMQLHLHALENGGRESPGRARQTLGRLQRSLRRLLQLTETVTHYARIADGGLSQNLEPVDLGMLVREVVQDLRSQGAAKGIELRLECRESTPPLVSDARLLRLIVDNLLGAALRVSERRGVVVVARQRDGVHELHVRDMGPGLSAAARAEILDPLSEDRDVRRSQGHGSGLGLSMLRDMVRAVGGTVLVDSEAGQGTTFVIRLTSLGATSVARAPRPFGPPLAEAPNNRRRSP